ncbi:aspartic proteinase 3 [Diutina rugosa]
MCPWWLMMLAVSQVVSMASAAGVVWTFAPGPGSLTFSDPRQSPQGNTSSLFTGRFQIGQRRPQTVNVAIDFGSSVSWLPSSQAQCAVNSQSDDQLISQINGQTHPQQPQWGSCDATTVFDSQKSSSFKDNGTDFAVTYTSATTGTQSVTGRYGIDTWSLNTNDNNNISISSFVFGVANRSEVDQGRLGLGLSSAPETQANTPSFLARMKQSGTIKRQLYSVFRSQIDTEVRSILFGAVDTKKFQGNLTTLPMIMTDTSATFGSPTQFQVTLTRLDITTLKKDPYPASSHNYPAIFDSGQRYTWLPRSLHNSLLEVINLKNRTELTVPCEVDGTIRIKFTFGGGAELDMPLNDLIQPSTTSSSECQLAILPHDDPSIILGDNVLRHAFVVYDHEKFEISVAPIMYTPETNVVEVDDHSSRLPGALIASDYAAVGQIYTVSSSASEAKPPRTIGNLMNGASVRSAGWVASLAAVMMMI